jgi:hypothetical protein
MRAGWQTLSEVESMKLLPVHSPRCRWQMQVDRQGYEKAWHEVDETRIAHEPRKFLAQVELDVLSVEPFKRAIPRLLEENEDGQDFRWMQPCGPSTAALS